MSGRPLPSNLRPSPPWPASPSCHTAAAGHARGAWAMWAHASLNQSSPAPTFAVWLIQVGHLSERRTACQSPARCIGVSRQRSTYRANPQVPAGPASHRPGPVTAPWPCCRPPPAEEWPACMLPTPCGAETRPCVAATRREIHLRALKKIQLLQARGLSAKLVAATSPTWT